MKGNSLTWKQKARTGLQWKIFVLLCNFVAYCTFSMNVPFCCQISENGRETKTWKSNRKFKQDIGS